MLPAGLVELVAIVETAKCHLTGRGSQHLRDGIRNDVALGNAEPGEAAWKRSLGDAIRWKGQRYNKTSEEGHSDLENFQADSLSRSGRPNVTDANDLSRLRPRDRCQDRWDQ